MTAPSRPRLAVVPNTAGEEPTNGNAFKRGDHVELAERMVSQLRVGDIDPVSALGAIYYYAPERGIWVALNEAELSKRVQAFAGAPVDRRVLSVRAHDVKGTIQLAHAQIAAVSFFDADSRGLAFTDGFIVIGEDGTLQRREHSPDNRARFAFPFAFQAEPCTKWFAFLRSLFRDDSDRGMKMKLIGEFFGAALFGLAPLYQRCLILEGGGDNGKSTLLKILSTVMPPGSMCAVAPQLWGNEYYRAMMVGRLLNIVSELPENDIIASGSFKAIVSGDAISARYIRNDPFTFHPTAGHAFAANLLPGTPDQSEGFWRRFAVLTFNRKFPDNEKNATIAEEIIAAELPGIVQWLVEGAVRLVTRKHYELPTSHDAALATWRATADQVAAYLTECTRPAEKNEGTTSATLYKSYAEWAKRNGHRALSSTKLGVRLRSFGKRRTSKGILTPFVLTLAGRLR